MPKLDSEQQKIIRTINREARYLPKGLRRKFKLAAIETGLVESGLHNLSGGDADSAGWRQERASLYKDPTNVAASVKRFREEFLQHYNPGERAGDVAAQVQRPASQYRGRYQAAKPQALQILQQYGGAPGPMGAAPGYQTTVSSTPGVDNSALRQQAKLAYLDQRGNPDALLELAQTLRDAQDIPGATTTSTRRLPGGAGSPKGGKHDGIGGPLFELFWQGPHGINVKNGKVVPQGFVDGHQDHVHVAGGRKSVVALGRLAQQMGLHVGENPRFGGVNPVHTEGSYHYKNEAIDVSGDPKVMARFAHLVARKYGAKR